jgi:hypothetical protein
MHWRTAKGPTGASTVLTTLAIHALPVSLTPTQHRNNRISRHASPVSMTLAKLAIFTVRYQWHWWHASPVSLTPANTCFAGVIDTGKCMLCRVRNFLPVLLTPVKLSKTVKVSLPVSLTPARNYSPVSMTPAKHALPVSLTPAKHRNNWISPRIFEKNRNRY